MLFPAVPAGVLFPVGPDQDGTLSRLTLPGYRSRPIMLEYCFRSFLQGYRFPADPAGILFPAGLPEPITVGVADVAVAGAGTPGCY